MALGITQMALQTLVMMKSDLQFFLLKLSDDLQFQQMQNAETLKQMNKKHERETAEVRAQFDDKDTVSGSDLSALQASVNEATEDIVNANTDATAAEVQAERERDTASYMEEINAMRDLTNRQDTERSNLIAENNMKEKSIEQLIEPAQARVKSVEANLENTDKAAKKAAENSVVDFTK